MKKCILLLMIVSKILFSGGEISFEKQKEKVEQERIEKLKMQTDSSADKSKELNDSPKEDTSNVQSQSNRLFYDDKAVKKVNNASHIQKNIGSRKLIEYIKTQNSRLNENEIQNIGINYGSGLSEESELIVRQDLAVTKVVKSILDEYRKLKVYEKTK